MPAKAAILLLVPLLLTGCLSQRSSRDPMQVGLGLPVRLDSPQARVISRYPEAHAAEVAGEFMGAVEKAATALALGMPEQPADLVVLAPGEEQAWGLYRIGGVSFPGPEGRVIFALANPLGERDRWVIRHEAIHWLLAQRLPIDCPGRLSGVPRWLDEGLATAFETIGENRERKGEFSRLASPRWRARIGLERTLDLQRGKAIASADYARAWAICTYLLRTEPETLVALLQARAEWCRKRPPGTPFPRHEEELVTATRADFDRLVLRGVSLDEWFDRVTTHLLAHP
jgi:hypothetical protein